jgi:uncharacterized protein YgbK (DUF1537 family)
LFMKSTGWRRREVPFDGYADDDTMTRPIGLAATFADAAALAEAFGPGAAIGLGHFTPDLDILAPAGPVLQPDAAAAAARAGAAKYFLAFGHAAPVAELAPLVELLCQAAGTGFMAACPAAPWAGRTMYQGHLFEGGKLRGNLVQEFAAALGGGVGLVAHETVRQGAAAIGKACVRLKEQGRILALIDALDDDDGAAVAEALGLQAVAGGGAWAAARPHMPEPAQPDGPVAILAGALDRQTNFQIGAARPFMPVFDLDFASADPVADATNWAAAHTGTPFIVTSTVAPDLLTPGAPAAAMLGRIAAGLAALGIQKFVVAGGATMAACLAELGITRLIVGAGFGPFRWLQAGKFAFCFKPAGAGQKNLFLSEFEPQNRLNEEAKS